MLTWVFFRANTTRDAFDVLGGIFSVEGWGRLNTPFNSAEMAFSVGLIGTMLWKEQALFVIPTRRDGVFWGVFLCLVALCYLFGFFTSSQFIYFQF
jgi:hypothetical protein